MHLPEPQCQLKSLQGLFLFVVKRFCAKVRQFLREHRFYSLIHAQFLVAQLFGYSILYKEVWRYNRVYPFFTYIHIYRF